MGNFSSKRENKLRGFEIDEVPGSYRFGAPSARGSLRCGGPRHRRQTRSGLEPRSPAVACHFYPPRIPPCHLLGPGRESVEMSARGPGLRPAYSS